MGFSFAAPLAGRDAISSAITGVYTPFQSTHPLRGATARATPSRRSWTFQSTRPLRGATLRRASFDERFAISIHAPLAGRDQPVVFSFEKLIISIHAPLAGRDTSTQICGRKRLTFQSTRPLRGATKRRCGHDGDGHISIHAPLAGRDAGIHPLYARRNDFNPRAPCGARQFESQQKVS